MLSNPITYVIAFFLCVMTVAGVRLIQKGRSIIQTSGLQLIIPKLFSIILGLLNISLSIAAIYAMIRANLPGITNFETRQYNNMSSLFLIILVALAIASFIQLINQGLFNKVISLLLLATPLLYFILAVIGLMFIGH